jgi:hypothetical protein
MQSMAMVPSEAKVDEIPTGAVLKLSARDKGQTQALRQMVHANVRAFKSGCLGQ